MSAAFVPGLMRRIDPASFSNGGISCSPEPSPTVGDLGPIWTSVKGGGLGRRGELEGDTPAAIAAVSLSGKGMISVMASLRHCCHGPLVQA